MDYETKITWLRIMYHNKVNSPTCDACKDLIENYAYIYYQMHVYNPHVPTSPNICYCGDCFKNSYEIIDFVSENKDLHPLGFIIESLATITSWRKFKPSTKTKSANKLL